MEEKRDIDIELKSEPMNEMLSNPPSWIIRSGNGLFLLILVLMIALSWIIKYSDEIKGEVLVTSSPPPIELSNQGYIQLKTLNVKENQQVKEGDLIAQFDIQAKSEDIKKAKNYLNELGSIEGQFQKQIPVFGQQLKLGTFKELWTTLLSKIAEWNSEHSDNMILQELASIQREISFREQLQVISNKKIKLSEGEYELIQEQLASSERLAEQKAISKQTLTLDKRTQTQALQSVQSQKEQHVHNLITLNTLRKELFRLKHDAKLKDLQMSSEIRRNISALTSGFQTWEKNSVWMAPSSGKIVFNKLLQLNRFYKANEASIVIVPKGSGYIAIATIGSEGSGKVKVGQKAFIELVDFPKAEFGMLEGKVSRITKIDKEGKYEVKILLPKQLKTSYKKDIPFKAQLKGTVKIITKDKRLLERFFEQLTALIK